MLISTVRVTDGRARWEGIGTGSTPTKSQGQTLPDAVDALVRNARGLVEELTPGQRWTSALATGLALVILAFGLPSASRIVTPVAAAQTPLDSGGELSEAGDQPDVLAEPSSPVPGPGTGGSNQPPPAAGTPDATPPPAPNPEPDDPSGGPVQIVALADPAGAFPGREDAAVALHFLLEANLSAAVEVLDDPTRVCSVASRASIAIASGALPPEVAACLGGAGVVTITWDDAVPITAGPSRMSTRRGAARSLLDTAARIDLDGRTALVADRRLRAALEPAVATAAKRGLAVSETVWLDGTAGPDVAIGLAGADIDNVVFATSTANQSTIASQLRPFVPSATYVVLDAADAVTTQSNLPGLDGARAATAVQFPWHPGNETYRSGCRSSWEGAQSPPSTLDGAELLRVLQWCQHVRLAAQVADLLATGQPAESVVDASALTSALGPLPGGGFGPTRVTVATWAAACSCWSAAGPFRKAGS